MKPTVGDTVLYKTLSVNPKILPALVLDVRDQGRATLVAFTLSGTISVPNAVFSENKEPGCWFFKEDREKEIEPADVISITKKPVKRRGPYGRSKE